MSEPTKRKDIWLWTAKVVVQWNLKQGQTIAALRERLRADKESFEDILPEEIRTTYTKKWVRWTITRDIVQNNEYNAVQYMASIAMRVVRKFRAGKIVHVKAKPTPEFEADDDD